jgi:hypothetical protein
MYPSKNAGFQVPGYHSWGGHAVPSTTPSMNGQADTVYHGYFSFLCDQATLGEWTTKSAIVHATASQVQGW